jgi:hypothetical protein
VLGLIHQHQPVQVSFVGGEPLIRHRELSRILPVVSERGVRPTSAGSSRTRCCSAPTIWRVSGILEPPLRDRPDLAEPLHSPTGGRRAARSSRQNHVVCSRRCQH